MTHEHTKKHRIRPTIAQKLVAISIVEASNVREAVAITGYDERRLRAWVQAKEKLRVFDGSTTRKKNTGKCGGKPILPDPNALALYVRDLRREERAVTSGHMINFLRMNHSEWIESYVATRKDGYNSLLRLLQKFAERYDFTRQRICRQKRTQCNLEEVRRDFARGFHGQYPDLSVDSLYNADETGLYYDMAPDTIWVVKGEGSYVADADKHSYRMTALLTVRADGKKLPILFVIRGAEGDTIERNEFDDYPDGHHYYMQRSLGWTVACGAFTCATYSLRRLRIRLYCLLTTLIVT
ncbi:hypothetical protein LEN26_013462 [Aphanomyces euteiches]|nr:hypothetical protein LEN26_013462 [Aphanomyces euteiches]